jgi:hypothetical protein
MCQSGVQQQQVLWITLCSCRLPGDPAGRAAPSAHAPMCRSEIEGMMAIVVRGDALEPESVCAAFGQVVMRAHVWLLRLGQSGVHSILLTRASASHPWG